MVSRVEPWHAILFENPRLPIRQYFMIILHSQDMDRRFLIRMNVDDGFQHIFEFRISHNTLDAFFLHFFDFPNFSDCRFGSCLLYTSPSPRD